ncbi:tumor necrosis factor receptor superfamily member 14-like isoform X2 [Pempheris klunzingeri]|uniref:tumor necrosis factor receptor superfamily member 14-like isoform X2 n=1 Tax=Pempheris klunzingeri TaxID=3127111 RepID=UPI0039817684
MCCCQPLSVPVNACDVRSTFVRRDCTGQSGTRCSVCDNGTFTSQPNGLEKCFPCTSCGQGHGLFVQLDCTIRSDTVCGAQSGHYCKSLADDTGCSLAEKHTLCAAGEGIKYPGTNTTDTVCELCQPGYFSQDGVNCTPWTICSGSHGKVKEGSASSDVVCNRASRQRYFYIPVLLSVLTLAGLVIPCKCHVKGSRSDP